MMKPPLKGEPARWLAVTIYGALVGTYLVLKLSFFVPLSPLWGTGLIVIGILVFAFVFFWKADNL